MNTVEGTNNHQESRAVLALSLTFVRPLPCNHWAAEYFRMAADCDHPEAKKGMFFSTTDVLS